MAETARNHSGLVQRGINIPEEECDIVENWRAAHGAALNTAQAWLRRLDEGRAVAIVQRLKRFDTIVDKLATCRVGDLSAMNDIAGVRLVFKSLNDLHHFRKKIEASRAKHVRTHERNRYNYIENPKPSGYRGVHEVFRRNVSSVSGQPWNGLKFEVQLRTVSQHVWATAVEIFDNQEASRYKFEKSDDLAYQQFALVSELFARCFENDYSNMQGTDNTMLASHLVRLEQETSVIQKLRKLRRWATVKKNQKFAILLHTTDGRLQVKEYRDFITAARALAIVERHDLTKNAVAVGGGTGFELHLGYINYFNNTTDFLQLYDKAMGNILPGYTPLLRQRLYMRGV